MKKQHILISVSLIIILAAPVPASAFEGFRGSTWGDLRGELPEDGEENLILQGWIRQGADWFRWGNTTLNTYMTLRYKWDSESYDWNNTIGPGVGISLETYSEKGLVASWGVEYIWERFYESDRSDQKVMIFMGWYGWWDLKRR